MLHIDWGTLGTIAVVAAAAALTVVLLVALAIVGASSGLQPQEGAPEGAASVGRHTVGGMAVAVLCLLATGLVVAYGVYLIVA